MSLSVVSLLTDLKKMLESEFKALNITAMNKNIDNNTILPTDIDININLSQYGRPNVYIAFRPASINQFDFPAVIIVPPSEAKDTISTKECDISFILVVKHGNRAQDNNACLEAISFMERVKDILFNNTNVGGFVLDFEQVNYGVDLIPNSPDITIAEINCIYRSINNYDTLKNI